MRVSLERYANISKEDREAMKGIYESSFPKEERFDYSILEWCCNRTASLYGIYADKELVGMCFMEDFPSGGITYLMYFAIDNDRRGEGIGTAALKVISRSNEKVFLCIERPNGNTMMGKNAAIRKQFYLNNGFYSTNVFIEDGGVQYEFMSTAEGWKPAVEDLKNRYRYMTSDPSCWEAIKDSFDVENIKIIK